MVNSELLSFHPNLLDEGITPTINETPEICASLGFSVKC